MAAWRQKKRSQNARFSLLLGLCLCLLLSFVLLPLPWQKSVFHAIGLSRPRPATNQSTTLPNAPIPLHYTYVSSTFGPRWGRMHQGIDLAAETGEPVYAVSGGYVLHSGWEPGYGKSVVIAHSPTLKTRYAHCSKVLVKAGQTVQRGSAIAHVGSTGHSTGPHLHFEVLVNGLRKDPQHYYHFEPTPQWETTVASQKQEKDWVHSLADLMKLWRTS